MFPKTSKHQTKMRFFFSKKNEFDFDILQVLETKRRKFSKIQSHEIIFSVRMATNKSSTCLTWSKESFWILHTVIRTLVKAFRMIIKHRNTPPKIIPIFTSKMKFSFWDSKGCTNFAKIYCALFALIAFSAIVLPFSCCAEEKRNELGNVPRAYRYICFVCLCILAFTWCMEYSLLHKDEECVVIFSFEAY